MDPRRASPRLCWSACSIATVLAAFDPLLFIRIKTERGSVSYGFGEISFVAACYLVPPDLLPATTLVGVFCAQLTNLWMGRLPSFSRVLSSAGALSLSAAAGATVVSVRRDRWSEPLRRAGAAAVGAGAMTFCVVSVLLVSARNAMTPPTQAWVSMLDRVWRKVPMGVGNTAAGLVGLTAVSSTPWSLLAVPPIIWLLHQTYAYRLRSDNERSAWKTFASATQDLNHGDERSTTTAGSGRAAAAVRRAPGADRHRRARRGARAFRLAATASVSSRRRPSGTARGRAAAAGRRRARRRAAPVRRTATDHRASC